MAVRDETTDRQRALEAALLQIEKAFGKGAVMRLGERALRTPIEAIPTGALSLDLALGVGGVPRGRVIEIYGPESSGKTTLASTIVAQAKSVAAPPPTSTSSMRSIPNTAPPWGSTSTGCSSASPTAPSRRWRSPKPWFAATQSTSW
ncbi:MAG: hypothetical protein KatS3mg060_3114 [Dehalococcoidia bacterium]|nr:MAG: hypothetical protein KatS3mg060_3114 [Dehalococcoidia bacterium]